MDKLIRGTAAAFAVFAGVFAFIVGQRIDQITMALLGGVLIGLLVTVPVFGALVYAAIKTSARNQELLPSRQHFYAPMPQPQPQFWSPASPMRTDAHSFSDASSAFPAPAMFQLPPQRKFYVIGDDGAVEDAS